MKKTFLLLPITTFLSGCESDDNNSTPSPVAQTEAGIFAGYINENQIRS